MRCASAESALARAMRRRPASRCARSPATLRLSATYSVGPTSSLCAVMASRAGSKPRTAAKARAAASSSSSPRCCSACASASRPVPRSSLPLASRPSPVRTKPRERAWNSHAPRPRHTVADSANAGGAPKRSLLTRSDRSCARSSAFCRSQDRMRSMAANSKCAASQSPASHHGIVRAGQHVARAFRRIQCRVRSRSECTPRVLAEPASPTISSPSGTASATSAPVSVLPYQGDVLRRSDQEGGMRRGLGRGFPARPRTDCRRCESGGPGLDYRPHRRPRQPGSRRGTIPWRPAPARPPPPPPAPPSRQPRPPAGSPPTRSCPPAPGARCEQRAGSGGRRGAA